MIRLTLLSLFVAATAAYAWKDWFKSLCGLILLMAVIQHPDMPKSLFGIQGLNPWNLLFLDVTLAWAVSRRRERLAWDMPSHVNVLLLLYLGVVLVGFGRMMADRRGLGEYTTAYLVSEDLINTIKWVVPGLLLFDGCRSRARFNMALSSVLGLYFLLAVYVIRWMPLSSAMSGEALSDRSVKILVNEVGYHRVNLSVMLAGASWAIFATRSLARRRVRSILIMLASLATLFAQALTGGRAGYAAWGVVGLALCTVRWRRYLLLVPVVALGSVMLVPGVAERMFEGFSPVRGFTSGAPAEAVHDSEPDVYTITAGRNLIWPYVIAKIGEAPVFGYGREAMERTYLKEILWDQLSEGFGHPHNAYLEMLLDNGLVGFLLVMPFYAVVVIEGFRLFRDGRSPFFVAIGGVASALVLALLVGALGSQSFYPREGSVGMWCAIGLLFRVSVERSRALAAIHARRRSALSGPGHTETPARGLTTGPRSDWPRRGQVAAIDSALWRRTA